MDKRILIGAALLGGFVIYKTNKPLEKNLGKKVLDEVPMQEISETYAQSEIGTAETPAPYKNDAVTPYEVLSAGALPDDDKNKIIEAIKKEDNFQRGKFFVVQITGSIFLLSAGVAYLIKLTLDNIYGTMGADIQQSVEKSLRPKMDGVNQEFEDIDFGEFTDNKVEQKSLADKFNKSFKKFKSSIIDKINNIKNYIDPYRPKKLIIEKGKNDVVDLINKIPGGEKQDFYMKKYEGMVNNRKNSPSNESQLSKEQIKEWYKNYYDKYINDILQFKEDLLRAIERNKNEDIPKNIYFSDLDPKSRVIFLGENPLEQFHEIPPGFVEQDNPVYLSEFQQSDIYEQMQLQSAFYEIARDSLNDVLLIQEIRSLDIESGEEFTEKPTETITGNKPPETGFSDIEKKKVTYTEETEKPTEKPLISVEDIQYDIGIRPEVKNLLIFLEFYRDNISQVHRKSDDYENLSKYIDMLKDYNDNDKLIITKDFMKEISDKIRNLAINYLNTDNIMKIKVESTKKPSFERYYNSLSKILDKF